MKKLSYLLIMISVMSVFSSCNKESVDKQSSTKTNEKKEALNQEKNNSGKDVATTNSLNSNLFKLDKVEKSAGSKSAPNFFWTEKGSQVSLKDLKGKVILVNLWATWCGPCVREMPDLSKISEELKEKNFRMLGVNVFQQANSKKVEDFLKSNPVSYTIIDGSQEIVDAFSEADGKPIEAVPTTFIIDKSGKIAETIIGGRDKETFLKLINKYLN
ncbi:MAG: TlpA family protein disulfide reductase [Bacteroidetes bacterium]|nr:TlpA family protein disulfide reductase [Bacteroidota bacterium]